MLSPKHLPACTTLPFHWWCASNASSAMPAAYLRACLLARHQVENGKGAMPAWSGTLDDDEIQAVAAYVFDQASGDKW